MADDNRGETRAATEAVKRAIRALEADPGNKAKFRAAREAIEKRARLSARAQERAYERDRKGAARGSASDRERRAVASAVAEFNTFWDALLGRASKRVADSTPPPSSTTKSDGSSWWSD